MKNFLFVLLTLLSINVFGQKDLKHTLSLNLIPVFGGEANVNYQYKMASEKYLVAFARYKPKNNFYPNYEYSKTPMLHLGIGIRKEVNRKKSYLTETKNNHFIEKTISVKYREFKDVSKTTPWGTEWFGYYGDSYSKWYGEVYKTEVIWRISYIWRTYLNKNENFNLFGELKIGAGISAIFDHQIRFNYSEGTVISPYNIEPDPSKTNNSRHVHNGGGIGLPLTFQYRIGFEF